MRIGSFLLRGKWLLRRTAKRLIPLRVIIRLMTMRVISPRVIIRLFVLYQWWVGSPELRLLSSLTDPQRNSVDVGANIGVWSFLLARISKRVIAYEPNPDLASLLVRSMPKNVTVRQVALSSQQGLATLSIPSVNKVEMMGLATLRSIPTETTHRRLIVQTARLDDESLENVGFIKIDVEGHEASVIKGAENLIRRNRPLLLVEIEQRYLDQDIQTVFSRILSLGYEGWYLRESQLCPIEKFSVERDQMKHTSNPISPYINDFIFVPTTKVKA